MKAIIKKEFSTYFKSPLGYVFIAVYLFFSGMFFSNILYMGYSSQFPQVYYSMFDIIMLILPLLTMRLFSEDKKYKTDQALLTAPISITSLVVGKYLSALCIYAMCVAMTIVYAIVFSFFAEISWALVVCNLIGALLFGGAFIAIGVFISSLTESLVIAAMGTFVVSAFFLLMNVLIPTVNGNVFYDFLANWISFNSRYTPFTEGILDFSSIIYFLSIIASFLFLTVRAIESKRWS